MWPFKKKDKPKVKEPKIRDFVIKIGKSLEKFDGWRVDFGKPNLHYIHKKCRLKIAHPLETGWVLLWVDREEVEINKTEENHLDKILGVMTNALLKEGKILANGYQDGLINHILECTDL